MKTKDIFKDYNFAKAKVDKVISNATGWDVVQHQEAGFGGIKLYICDVKHSWVWACSISKDEFIDISSQAASGKVGVDMIRSGLNGFIYNKINNQPLDKPDLVDWETSLAVLASLYLGTTRTWEIAWRGEKGGHFIVLRYTQKKCKIKGDGILRPLFMGESGDKRLIPFDEFKLIVESVYAKDKKNHPDWFN